MSSRSHRRSSSSAASASNTLQPSSGRSTRKTARDEPQRPPPLVEAASHTFDALGGASADCGRSRAWVGWYFSDRLLDPIHPRIVENLRAYALADGRITLPSTAKTRTRQIWGVAWPGGYGQVFGPVSVSGSRVSRRFRILDGTLRPDMEVGLDVDAYPSDPRTAFGLAYRTVSVRSSLGVFPAWEVPGRRGTWVIFVHGRGAT